MAKMTRGELRSELQARGFDGFLTTDLDRYINWGYFDLARRLRLPLMDAAPTFTLTAGQYRQAMSALTPPIRSVRKLINISDGKEAKLEAVSEGEFWRSYAPVGFVDPGNSIGTDWRSTPQWYYVYQGYIIVLPACDSNCTFQVESWQQVTAMTDDSDEHLIPEEDEELLLISVLRICHTRANEPDLATGKLQELEFKLKDVQDDEGFTSEELPERTEKEDWGVRY